MLARTVSLMFGSTGITFALMKHKSRYASRIAKGLNGKIHEKVVCQETQHLILFRFPCVTSTVDLLSSVILFGLRSRCIELEGRPAGHSQQLTLLAYVVGKVSLNSLRGSSHLKVADLVQEGNCCLI
jgi:hypothetical protein